MFGACHVIEREQELVLSIRLRTPFQDLSQAIGDSYGKIYTYLREVGQMPAGEPFVGYFNMDMEDLDVEIGYPVAMDLPGQGDMKMSAIPAGKYAAMVYTGPYSELKDAYRELSEWMEKNGHVSNYLAYEIYLNDPAQVAEEKLETKILLGVK